MIRFFDIVLSVIGLILFSPVFIFVAIWIKTESKGPVFFKQKRIGLNEQPFLMFKFRSMFLNSDKKGLITVGARDPRITRSGYYIRKYKLDELPQLLNVLIGDMSFVGPRPEVEKYVKLYNNEQRKVLTVRPGITDYASICYRNENEELSGSSEPERHYINVIMPEKLKLNLLFIQNRSVTQYFKIILKTVFSVF